MMVFGSCKSRYSWIEVFQHCSSSWIVVLLGSFVHNGTEQCATAQKWRGEERVPGFLDYGWGGALSA